MEQGAEGQSKEQSAIEARKPAKVAQCHAVIELLALQVQQLGLQVEQQRQQIAVLQEQVKLDSNNSSKPPSSDGPGRGNRAQRSLMATSNSPTYGHSNSPRQDGRIMGDRWC